MARTIQEIITNEDDPGLVHWLVGGERLGPIRRDFAGKIGIQAGAPWTKAKAQKVEHLSQLHACQAAALAFLARRDYSKALLLERLSRRWPRAIAEITVKQMCAAGWVDDKAYASRRAARISERAIVSSDLLEARLASEGVPDSIALRAARSAATPMAKLSSEAKRLHRSGFSARKIAGKFSRAGFDVDTIQSAFAKARIPWDPES